MAFHCKGDCRNPDIIPTEIITKRPSRRIGYADNVNYCSICEKGYLKVDWVKCPCCKNVLRTPECNLQARIKAYIDASDIETEVLA